MNKKTFLVIGLGESGIKTAIALSKEGHRVLISEERDDEEVLSIKDSLISMGVASEEDIELGRHSRAFVDRSDCVVPSPGVIKDAAPLQRAAKREIPVINEVELAFKRCPGRIIAVTGTSGKTTVATLVFRCLVEAGKKAVLCGNIGNPFIGELSGIDKETIVVLEVSSFQLEWVKDFSPWISVILNISENHLDRHRDFEEYYSLKKRVFLKQSAGDIAFFNGRDNLSMGLAKEAGCRAYLFDVYKNFASRFKIDNENYLAVASIASCAGVPEDIILECLSSFNGIEHRMERVAVINGIEFINDSKATTVSSVQWALRSLDRPVNLIMGGRYKGGDFGVLKDIIGSRCRNVFLLGEAAPLIRKHLHGITGLREVATLREAVLKAFESSKGGDVVLLSPGCSSFDMFTGYKERGAAFKEYCLYLDSAARKT